MYIIDQGFTLDELEAYIWASFVAIQLNAFNKIVGLFMNSYYEAFFFNGNFHDREIFYSMF